jgi:hypothetical protein
LKNLLTENSSVSGSPLSRLAAARNSAQIISRTVASRSVAAQHYWCGLIAFSMTSTWLFRPPQFPSTSCLSRFLAISRNSATGSHIRRVSCSILGSPEVVA